MTEKWCGVAIISAAVTLGSVSAWSASQSSSSPGIIQRMEQVERELVPPGTVIAFAGSQAPLGWAPCDGKAVTKDQDSGRYSRLIDAIGTSWSEGKLPCKLPDLRNQFLRGSDEAAHVGKFESGRTAKPRNQNFGLSETTHSHSYKVYPANYNTTGGAPAGLFTNSGQLAANEIRNVDGGGEHSHKLENWDEETRPANYRVLWIIKL